MESCEQLLLERATLHGKLEEHDKALHILVHELKDFSSAEAFCTWASSCRDSSYQQQLFHMLLGVYLDGTETEVGGGEGDLRMAAVDLLNRHGEVFDAVRVLHMLPEGWSLQLLRPFLGRAIRASMHACRTSQVALGLSRSENLQLLHDRVRIESFNWIENWFWKEKKSFELDWGIGASLSIMSSKRGTNLVNTYCVVNVINNINDLLIMNCCKSLHVWCIVFTAQRAEETNLRVW